MALDSVVIYALKRELSEKLTGGRIEKAYQPERDEILLSVRTFTSSYKLVISASPSNARVHFTAAAKENPKVAPMFCMLLRKHLQSGKITEISQPGYERMLKITVESRNELGDLVNRYLIAELMGRNSNIILTDENGIIIDAARRVDFTQSSVRQILPGVEYKAPPAQDKIAVLDEHRAPEIDFSDASAPAARAVMASISGISPITARELIFRVTGDCDKTCRALTDADRAGIYSAVERYRSEIFAGKFCPNVICEADTGRLIDFSATEITQYSDRAECTVYPDMSAAIEAFFRTRDTKERIKQRSTDLLQLINTNLERLSKKLVLQQKTLSDAKNKEQYRRIGDLITANIYLISPGAQEAVLPDYFTEGAPEAKIHLNPALTPAQNAQKYYKKYNKAKTAEIEMQKQIESAAADIEYLESMQALVQNCLDISDIDAIRTELAAEGYIRRTGGRKAKKDAVSKPHHFISSDGFDIYVGKNNLQNDTLTLRFANSSDIWFHTKKIHGSHTVIKLGIDKEVPRRTMLEAAALAAYFSKARTSNQVPVDYTQIKNVKKPNGAKPGMVIYDGYNTIYTAPKSPAELSLEEVK